MSRDASPKRPAFNTVLILPEKASYELLYTKKDDLEALQTYVDGSITLLQAKHKKTNDYIVYCNEEGVLKRMPFNAMAGAMLYLLGFRTDYCMPPFLPSGPAVMMRKSGKAFTKAQLEEIEKASRVAGGECDTEGCGQPLDMKAGECTKALCKNFVCKYCKGEDRVCAEHSQKPTMSVEADDYKTLLKYVDSCQPSPYKTPNKLSPLAIDLVDELDYTVEEEFDKDTKCWLYHFH